MKSTISTILKSALPIIIGQLGTVAMGITNTIMLGWEGREEVAAIGLANQLFFVITILGMGCMGAISSIVAGARGADQKEECGEFLRAGIELGFLLSILLIAILFIISENIEWLGQTPSVQANIQAYLRIINISVLPFMLFLALKQYAEGLTHTRPAMVITFVAVFLNIFLNWVFIYGKFTFPAMGIKGAALATLFSRIFMAGMMVLVLFQSKKISIYFPPLVSKFNTKPILLKLIKIGIPSGLQQFCEVLAIAVVAVLIGRINSIQLAAHQVMLALAALAYVISSGVAAAGSIEIGVEFGKKNWTNLYRKAKLVLLTIILVTSCLAIGLVLGRNSLPAIFIQDAEVLAISVGLVFFAAFFQLIDGLQTAVLLLLRSVEDVRIPTYITFFFYCFFTIPLAFVLGIYIRWEVYGVWLALCVGMGLSSLALYVRFLHLKKNTLSNKLR